MFPLPFSPAASSSLVVTAFFPGAASSCRSLQEGEGSSQGQLAKPGEREAPWACSQKGVPSGHATSLGKWSPERKECVEGFCSPDFPTSWADKGLSPAHCGPNLPVLWTGRLLSSEGAFVVTRVQEGWPFNLLFPAYWQVLGQAPGFSPDLVPSEATDGHRS